MTCHMAGKMRSEVIGLKSAELLPTATVVISPSASRIKTTSVYFLVWPFKSEAKLGRPPRATCRTRNRRLGFARESWWNENRWTIEIRREEKKKESRIITYAVSYLSRAPLWSPLTLPSALKGQNTLYITAIKALSRQDTRAPNQNVKTILTEPFPHLHHSLSAHLLLKCWNVSGTSSWWAALCAHCGGRRWHGWKQLVWYLQALFSKIIFPNVVRS